MRGSTRRAEELDQRMKFDGKLEGREISPRATRIDVRYDALVQCEAGEVDAQILNLSAKGFRLRSRAALEEGWEVSLSVPRVAPVRATIRWTRGLEAGGMFLEAGSLLNLRAVAAS